MKTLVIYIDIVPRLDWSQPPALTIVVGILPSILESRMGSQREHTLNIPLFPASFFRVGKYDRLNDPMQHFPHTERPQCVQLWCLANIPNFTLQCIHRGLRGAGIWGVEISVRRHIWLWTSSTISKGSTSSEPMSVQESSHFWGIFHFILTCAPCLTSSAAAKMSWWYSAKCKAVQPLKDVLLGAPLVSIRCNASW